MMHKVKDLPEERINKDECNHYWLIDSAEGPTSKGVCKFCSAEKEFFNSFQDFMAVKQPTRVLKLQGMPDIELDEEKSGPDKKVERSG
ncbi:hypothetical protein ACFLUO_00725 [Chloroflexota bacterium]